MQSLFIVLSGVLGLIIGSFLNVVILRHNTERKMDGRSQCFSCGKTLQWYELIPVVSFFIQHSRCRGCGSSVAWQYPLVELLTAVLFALTAWRFLPTPVLVVYYWLALSILIVLTVYDLKHKIIPDSLVYKFTLLALFRAPIQYLAATISFADFLWSIANALLAGGVLFFFFWVLWFYSCGRWMGFGDAKIGLGLGLLLGLSGSLSALFLAFWIGAIIGLSLIAISRADLPHRRASKLLRTRFTIKSEIPFAPFLFLGLILNLLFDINFLPF